MAVSDPKSKREPNAQQRSTANQRGAGEPKVLRIGIIQNGKILEERIIRKRETVIVGPSEKSHFVIVSKDLPSRFEMFEMRGGEYLLNFFDTMRGRISVPNGVKELEDLVKSKEAIKRGKVYQVALNDQSRGKVIVGESTILFQFVTPPPIQPRPQLPAAVRGGLFRNFDAFLSIVWLLCFSANVGAIVYLRNADWPVESAWEKYLELEEIIVPREVTLEKDKEKGENPGEDAEADKEDKQKRAKKANVKKDTTKDDENQAPQKTAEQIAQERAARREALAEQLAQRGINKIIGTLGGDGEGVISDVLRGGDVGADQDDLLSQVSGVGVASGDNSGKLIGPAGGKGSGEAADISQLRMEGGDAVVQTEGPGQEKKVKGQVKRKDPSAVDGTGVLSAQEVTKVVNRRLGAIKGCYERALRRNPTLEGKITVRFTVAGTGKVTAARTTLNELTPEVGSCVISAFLSFRFPPPDGGSATFEYPFLFTPAN